MTKNYLPNEYYLGFDIGTNSVGWAVTDKDYNLCRFRGKDMWGIRLFPEADTAEGRRQKRTARRRLRRRNQRIRLLQMLFAEEIGKVDETFFIRLNESKLHYAANEEKNDKSTPFKQVLFADKNYTDIDYYKEYPTIYHLRKELLTSTKPHDVRLVYLALHHIMKSRGHFLIDGDVQAAEDFGATFQQFMNVLNDTLPFEIDVQDVAHFEEILKDRNKSRSDKEKALVKLIAYDEESVDKAEKKKRKDAVTAICKLVVGNQGDIKKMFGEELTVEDSFVKVKFSESKYDEQIVPELQTSAPEELYVLNIIKSLYDWSVLVDILGNEKMLSFAKVKAYETHRQNLATLRRILKKYCDTNIYKEFFDGKNGENNYSNYIGHVKTNGIKRNVKKSKSEEEFYKNLLKILESIESKIEPADKADYEQLVTGTQLNSLLPLQRSKENSVVPKQVHEIELKKILENASKYLPFLTDADEEGKTTADKILSIFNFRIPYYVGPLSTRHQEQGANVWIKRKDGKEDEYIYPWNFDDVVDGDASNEAFIRRMTNKCTYLPWEDVLPKSSLLYQRYMVLNELNNLKIRGKEISVALKQELFEKLFVESKTKVTGKKLLNYLQKNDQDLTLDDLSGFDIDFKSSLSSYHALRENVFGERMAEDHIREICEDIIKWATIYDDRTMVARMAKKIYGDELDEKQLKAIRAFRCSGWGQFSKAFLQEVEGANTETGEIGSIIDALWNTNCNLMQVLSSRFTYTEEIKNLLSENLEDISKVSYEDLVEGLFTSPANKRAIWQTIQIAEEIRKVMGKEPKKIFVEMARGGEKDKKRKTSRKQRLLDLYQNCDETVREWALADIESRDEREFNSKKLFLYYTQMGRCAYTGNPIDLDELMRGSTRWDIDHIYPQSRIKDDSLDNMVLAERARNIEKSDQLIPAQWQQQMRSTWQLWLNKNLISKKKYDRLTRTADFTVDELSGFLARQLVETRQSTKLVADLLDRMYDGTKIVRVKAGLVSDFRHSPLNVLKSRRVNDFHHAKDAYLNIVVGNVYNTRFTDNYRKWVKQNKDGNWSINKVFYFNVDGAWVAPDKEKGDDGKMHAVKNEQGNIYTGTLDTVRKTVRQNNVLYTEYTWCEKGQLFDETIQVKEKATSIPLKKELPSDKYGGYTSPNTSYFAQVEFDGKKGERIKNIIGVPIYVASRLDTDPNAFIDYCAKIKGMKNVKVLVSQIKKNSLLVVDGFPMRIRGENEKQTMFKSNLQLKVDWEREEYIRRIEKVVEKNYEYSLQAQFDGITDSILVDTFDELLAKMERFHKRRPGKQTDNVKQGRELFVELQDIEKVKVINEMLTLLRCDVQTTANLTLIGGSPNAGNMAASKSTVGTSTVTLVNQSVTGLYEKREHI